MYFVTYKEAINAYKLCKYLKALEHSKLSSEIRLYSSVVSYLL